MLWTVFMNPEATVSNTLINKSEEKYLTSCLAVFASKTTLGGSMTVSSSSVPFLLLDIHLMHVHLCFHLASHSLPYYCFGSEDSIYFLIFISHYLIKHYEKQRLAKWLLRVMEPVPTREPGWKCQMPRSSSDFCDPSDPLSFSAETGNSKKWQWAG